MKYIFRITVLLDMMPCIVVEGIKILGYQSTSVLSKKPTSQTYIISIIRVNVVNHQMSVIYSAPHPQHTEYHLSVQLVLMVEPTAHHIKNLANLMEKLQTATIRDRYLDQF